MATGSKSARMTPALGLAFFISAMRLSGFSFFGSRVRVTAWKKFLGRGSAAI